MTGSSPGDGSHGGETLVIVCAYPDGLLSGPWFRAYKRAKLTIRRGSFRAHVELDSIADLPPRIDVLIVPPSLEDVAAVAPGVREHLVATPDGLHHAFDQLVERLVHEGRLLHAPAPPRAVAVHRGFQAVGERARLVE